MDGPSIREHACVAQILVWLHKTCFGEILNLRYLPRHLFYSPSVKNVLNSKKTIKRPWLPQIEKKIDNFIICGQRAARKSIFMRDGLFLTSVEMNQLGSISSWYYRPGGLRWTYYRTDSPTKSVEIFIRECTQASDFTANILN